MDNYWARKCNVPAIERATTQNVQSTASYRELYFLENFTDNEQFVYFYALLAFSCKIIRLDAYRIQFAGHCYKETTSVGLFYFNYFLPLVE